MLVVISDIHFVDGTAGEHNLPYPAFKDVFLSDVASLAKDKKAKELKILLLGDIIDVTRSAQWFNVKPEDRPWGPNGLADVPKPQQNSKTEEQTLKIIGQVSDVDLNHSKPPNSLDKNTILYKNWDTFKLFREFGRYLKDEFKINVPVEIIYVPGNHDRLCNLYPSVRKELQRILGLTVDTNTEEDDINGGWRYRWDFKDETYGVYARHGHQYDVWNYCNINDHSHEAHLKVPMGDVFTTEFAVKIPWTLNTLRKNYSAVSDELIKNLKDIDNVRPLSCVMEWVYYRVKNEDSGEVRKALNETFDLVIKGLLDNKIIQNWRSPETHWDEALRAISSPWLRWLSKTLVDKLDIEDMLPLFISKIGDPTDPEKDVYLQASYKETIWRKNNDICFILYGHTHNPLQRPLDYVNGREVIYLNTGTWRNRIIKTTGLDKSPDFMELKQMTYSIFYRKDEDTDRKMPNTVSFDV